MTRFASLTAGLLARKGAAEPLATPFADPMLTRVGANGPDLREYSSSGVSGGSVRHLALNSAFGRRSAAAGLETAYADCGSLPPLAAPDVAREEEIVHLPDAAHIAGPGAWPPVRV